MNTAELFKSLLRSEVDSFAVIKEFKAGAIILSEDNYIQAIPIVLKGSLKVLRTDPDGREILLYYIQPGESCIMSFLGGIHHETSKVKALVEEDCEILMIPVAKAGDWIKKFPEWTDYIFKLYHKRFEELLSVVNAIAFQQLDDRLWHLLEKRREIYHSNELIITHQQLADDLGSTREVISRILKQFEAQGKVRISRNKIELM